MENQRWLFKMTEMNQEYYHYAIYEYPKLKGNSIKQI